LVREGINSSSRINRLSFGAELLYRRLMLVADDYGRFHASPATIRGACWPLCPEKVTEKQVGSWLSECYQGEKPLLSEYMVDGARYLIINDFGQQIRTRSKYPEPDSNLKADCSQPASSRRSRISEAKAETQANAEPTSVRAAIPALRKPNADDLNGQTSPNFEAWFALWAGVRGNAHRAGACQAYISTVLLTREADAMACTGSYIAGPGADPAHGYRPDNFLFEMARDGFQTRWPAAANGHKKLSATERALQKAREEDARNGVDYTRD
jgi:hypothetical protein